MQQIVSITRQGQITVPAAFRRLLALDQYQKALVRAVENKIVVEPIPDVMNLAGSLKNRAIKDEKIDKIIKIEKRAVSKTIGQNYLSKNK